MKWKAFDQASWSSMLSSLKKLVRKAGDNSSAISSLGEDIVSLSGLMDEGIKGLQSQLSAHTGSMGNPHNVTAAQAGAVPTTRKVNNKALSADISLTAADVGAATMTQVNTAINATLGSIEAALSEV